MWQVNMLIGCLNVYSDLQNKTKEIPTTASTSAGPQRGTNRNFLSDIPPWVSIQRFYRLSMDSENSRPRSILFSHLPLYLPILQVPSGLEEVNFLLECTLFYWRAFSLPVFTALIILGRDRAVTIQNCTLFVTICFHWWDSWFFPRTYISYTGGKSSWNGESKNVFKKQIEVVAKSQIPSFH
jgi:hypothetical protein